MAAATVEVEGHIGTGENLTFCSWNVNGINEPVKRGKVLSHLRELQADVIFLQETNLKNEAHGKIRTKWISQVYHSKFSAKARGVAIIIHKNVPFLHKSTIADKEGRYILVIGEIHFTPITLLNIYGPNLDDSEFFRKTFSLIPDTSTTNLIIGGDFNMVLDTYLDRSSTQRVAPSNASNFLNTFIKNTNLFDVWRTLNVTGREYSFYSRVHNVYTRIDYFLLDGKLMSGVNNVKYHNIIISDHCLVSVSLGLLGGDGNSYILEVRTLTRKQFCEYLETQIKLFANSVMGDFQGVCERMCYLLSILTEERQQIRTSTVRRANTKI